LDLLCSLPAFLLLVQLRRPPPAPLFPYTTLFRSATLIVTPHILPEIGQLKASTDGIRQRDVPRGRRAAKAKHDPAHGIRRLSAVDRKSTRLNSSHSQISYAVFCLKRKT